MARPVIWSKDTPFFPIGITPPICLTQSLSPEKRADTLLLDCGDARSILYTVYADLGDGNRHLDFTCCDLEPAVLARNILLLTMIAEGVDTDSAWSIFFHLFLDEASHNILIAQCRTLIQTSSNMKTWKDSKYGNYIRFCTERTLSEIRRHWILYAKHGELPDEEHEILRSYFRYAMKDVLQNAGDEESMLPAMRASGFLFTSVVRSGKKLYSSFWTKGVTTSTSPQTTRTPYVNPTFVYSVAGKNFNVHYSINPITSFHLAPAIMLGKNGHEPTPEDLVDFAKSQFSSWCSSFKTRLSSASTANVVVRFFVGESLAFCQALQICRSQKTINTGIYACSWGGPPITFDAGDYNGSSDVPTAPLLFNVIDTSGLADQLGHLNLLIGTVPLLDRQPWSVLQTTIQLRSHHLGPPKSVLGARACADIPTLSTLLGIAPAAHLWHFTTQSNKHDIIIYKPIPPGQIYERVSWQFVSSYVPHSVSSPQDRNLEPPFAVLCDSEKLGSFFFSVYMRMFVDENVMATYGNITLEDYHIQSPIHYSRASFAAFLAMVKDNVEVDWGETMKYLTTFIRLDPVIATGLNNFQDLLCEMYLRDIHTDDKLTLTHIESVRTSRDRFHGWRDVPVIVCIVLKIPRQKLRHLEQLDPNEIMEPMLQCNIYNNTFCNVHSSIHLTFGTTQVSVVDGEQRVTIHEDPTGWNGNSPLIATFYVPSWNLTIEPTSTQVGLHFHITPSSSNLVSRLGLRLTIFSALLTDTNHVYVVRHRPKNSQEIESLRNTTYGARTASQDGRNVTLKFNSSGEKATHLVIRKAIADDSAAAQSLASGSEVSVAPIADNSVVVTFGEHKRRLIYPFPIQLNHLQTRIARKSSYIEIEAPFRQDFSNFQDLSLNPFAVAYDDSQINLLNIHYINLDVLPALSLPGERKDIDWLFMPAGMMFSHPEKQARTLSNSEERGPLVNIKQSISSILLIYAGLQPEPSEKRTNVFALAVGDGDVHTFIFVNAMKLDLSSHTVVLDACVVPVVDNTIATLGAALYIFKKHHFAQLATDETEKQAWSLLLPTLAERCRTWKHADTCEYRTRGIPATGSEHVPLCSCGKGKNLGQFGTLSEWKEFHPEATRVAIGLLYPFTLMEDIAKLIIPEPLPAKDKGPSKSHCIQCGGPGKLACSACMTTRYCSPECQKAHWKIHKPQCTGRK